MVKRPGAWYTWYLCKMHRNHRTLQNNRITVEKDLKLLRTF